MLPFFSVPKLTHYVLLVCAVLIGHGLQRYRARVIGLDHAQAGMLSFVLVVGAAYGAHWTAMAAQGRLWPASPALLLFPYAGGVSLGGIGGGFLAAAAYARWRRLPLLPHLDAAAWAFPPAWFVLRLGCFLAHDSLGKPYAGPLAVNAPSGPSHDLAVDEMLWAAALTAWFLHSSRHPGPALLISYGLLRAVIAPLRLAPSILDYAGAVTLITGGVVILLLPATLTSRATS